MASRQTPLVVIDGNLNVLRYRDELIQASNVIPFVQGQQRHITLKQDNPSPHVTKVVIDVAEQNIGVLPWPAVSSDLAPIEHVLDEMPNQPVTLAALGQTLVQIWTTFPMYSPTIWWQDDNKIRKNMEQTEATPMQNTEPTNIYQALKQARAEAVSRAEFLRKSAVILYDSVACRVGSPLLLLIIPIASIVIGSVYLFDCPAENLIPIFLIVAGCFTIVFYLPDIIYRVNRLRGKDYEGANKVRHAGCGILGFFLFVWFILGSIWVYGLYDDLITYPVTAANYCNPVLYYFAFTFITIVYGFLLLMLTLSCCLCCMSVS